MPRAGSGAVHEMTLALSLVRLVCDEAAKHHAVRVERVALETGIFVCVESHALAAAFEVAAEGTCADGASLEVIRTPADARCTDCGHRFELESPRQAQCPACGSTHLTLSGGRECRLVGITVADA